MMPENYCTPWIEQARYRAFEEAIQWHWNQTDGLLSRVEMETPKHLFDRKGRKQQHRFLAEAKWHRLSALAIRSMNNSLPPKHIFVSVGTIPTLTKSEGV